jgi:hypothetical protein
MQNSLNKLKLVGYIIKVQPKNEEKALDCYIAESNQPPGVLTVVYHSPRSAQFFRKKGECNNRIRPLKKHYKGQKFTIIPIGVALQ